MKNMLPQKLEAFFLDFDGVVVESTDIKTEAFYDLYLPYGKEVAKNARDYHLQYQGVNRYKKFDEIHRLFLNKTCSEEEKKSLSTKFSEIVFEKIINAPLVDGVVDFLREMQTQAIPVFLLSATPHEELLAICSARRILSYFTAAYGAPYEKSLIGEKIITDYQFNKENIVFIGDSISDFKAASALDIMFVGRVPNGEKNPFGSFIKTITNFLDLM